MNRSFADLWASIQILYSNFNAKYGRLCNTVVLLAVLALVVYSLTRAMLAGRKGRRRSSPLATHQPDPQHTRRAAESLSQAIRVESVTGQRAQLRELNRVLRERFPQVTDTMDCAVLPDGSMLLHWCAPQLSEQEPVLFAGHLDVVPGGDGWTVCEPFDGLRQDGRIYGRGALDCKGVVIALLEAAESLIAEGYAPRRDIYFAFGADEETGGQHGAKAIADTLAAQGLRFAMVLDEGGTIQDMECDGRTYSAAVVGVAEKRQAEYRITVNCPGGHTSQPNRTTAVGVLSEAICRVESAQPHHHVIPLVRQRLDAAISMYSFGKRFVIANRPLFRVLVGWAFRNDPNVNSLIRSTVVPTRLDGSFPAANVLPTTASAWFNARLLPGDTPEKLLSDLQELLSDLPLEVELLRPGEETFVTSEKEPMYLLLREVLQEQFHHLPCIPTLMPTESDARHYASLSDCVLRFTPLVTGAEGGGNPHQGDEFLAENALGLAVEVYRSLMRRL